jgi:hypothetical protein
MMGTAKRDREFITDLAAQRLRLRKSQVMRIGRLPGTDEARLGLHELQVLLIAMTRCFVDGKGRTLETAAVSIGGHGGNPFSIASVAPQGKAGCTDADSERSPANPSSLVSKAFSMMRASSAVRLFLDRSIVLAQVVAAPDEARLLISESIASRNRAESCSASGA